MSKQANYDTWSSPGAVVADSDAVQASDSEDTQGQSNDDNVKHFELWVEEKTQVFHLKETLKHHSFK